MSSVFTRLYRGHYVESPKAVVFVPLLLILAFIALCVFLAFFRSVRVIQTQGVILPKNLYVLRLPSRGFPVDNRLKIGGWVEKGAPLLTLRLEDGSLQSLRAESDGYIVNTSLRNDVDGPLPEGTLIASIVDPEDLFLQIPVREKDRGLVSEGGKVRYKYSTLTRYHYTSVQGYEVRILEDDRVDYVAIAALPKEHRTLRSIGKKVDVKLSSGAKVSLIDYFFDQ